MNRIVHHHAYVRMSHADVCSVLEAEGQAPLTEATRAAAEFASRIAQSLENISDFFDVDENVTLRASPIRHHQVAASVRLTWIADPDKRLLPNVTATLDISPIVPEGLDALTELVLHGEYTPPYRHSDDAADFFLERRVVNAVLHAFLNDVAERIETNRPD